MPFRLGSNLIAQYIGASSSHQVKREVPWPNRSLGFTFAHGAV